MKCALLLLVLLPLTAFGQTSRHPYPHQQKADSIVVFFFGEEIFQQYLKLDLKKSQYRLRNHDGVRKSGFDSNPTFKPNSFFYHYDFRHPAFSGETLVVTFVLDSAGQCTSAEDMRGLVRTASLSDSGWVTRQQALRTCRENSYRIKKKSIRLTCDTTNNVSYDIFQKTHDFRDIVPGDLVWKVDGEVKFRGDIYSGTFQVNVLNGTLSKGFAIPWD